MVAGSPDVKVQDSIIANNAAKEGVSVRNFTFYILNRHYHMCIADMCVKYITRRLFIYFLYMLIFLYVQKKGRHKFSIRLISFRRHDI